MVGEMDTGGTSAHSALSGWSQRSPGVATPSSVIRGMLFLLKPLILPQPIRKSDS